MVPQFLFNWRNCLLIFSKFEQWSINSNPIKVGQPQICPCCFRFWRKVISPQHSLLAPSSRGSNMSLEMPWEVLRPALQASSLASRNYRPHWNASIVLGDPPCMCNAPSWMWVSTYAPWYRKPSILLVLILHDCMHTRPPRMWSCLVQYLPFPLCQMPSKLLLPALFSVPRNQSSPWNYVLQGHVLET